MDIDFFKKFNDTHGHQVGDEVLRQVAKVLAKQSREMDVPCRYGGEEFAAILPATDAINACKVAERIRAAIEASTTVCEGKITQSHLQLGRLAIPGRRRCPAPDPPCRRRPLHLEESRPQLRTLAHRRQPKFRSQKQIKRQSPNRPSRYSRRQINRRSRQTPSGATFIQMLKRRVTESHRFGVPLSILYLKIEDFDIINRKYGSADRPANGRHGHASISKKRLREMDVLAKLENGEFVAMLPGSTQAEANRVAKTDVCGNRKLPAARRRSRVADSIAARHRGAQTRRNRARTHRPRHG